MGFGEKRGKYWRGRYKIEAGKYGTVVDGTGTVLRFGTKRDAKKAADEEEAKLRAGLVRVSVAGRSRFGDWVSIWFGRQDLAASTMQNYKRHIEQHLMPAFELLWLDEITKGDVLSWEKDERSRGYAESSIKTWRSTLHLILEDAVEDEGIQLDTNAAARRRGRGRRAGRSRSRGPEKTVTDPLGILLVAERAALLSGRDDEFVAVVTKGYTGIRWAEMVGLEAEYVRRNSIRIEWQLYELDTGELLRCPPKDDSHRTVDIPEWLSRLVSEHIARTQPQPCGCHGRKYVFSGHRPANRSASTSGAKLVDVARRAGVSTGTVSNVLNRPESVPPSTRDKVGGAIADLGYVRGYGVGESAAHWRRSGFATWLFQPAVSGWYPTKAPAKPRPVPLLAEPWPGVPVRGRNAQGRANWCWLPIAKGLTPHGLRHAHKTFMTERGTPSKLMDDRLGHDDGSVQARYTHITQLMRERLMEEMTEAWEESLHARRRMSVGSPVKVLDRLLRTEQRLHQTGRA